MAKNRSKKTKTIDDSVNSLNLTLFGYAFVAPKKDIPRFKKALEKFLREQNIPMWGPIGKRSLLQALGKQGPSICLTGGIPTKQKK